MERKMTSATSAPSASKPARPGFTPAFTLVELLVVIGIIVVLAGLLLPVLAHAMRQAHRTRIASDLNGISQALEAYKQDFGDYPRIIYTATTPYNGTGSGAAVLGKALLSLGGAGPVGAYNASNTYTIGQIVVVSAGTPPEYEAMANVPAGNTPPNTTYWAAIPLDTSQDGADGPGFRIRSGAGGRVYGPYLQPDKFKTNGLAIADYYGNPILYYPANPAHTVVTVAGLNAGSFGAGNSYVGTASGVTPNAAVVTPGGPCISLYNYSDNDTASLNATVGGTPFTPTTPADGESHPMPSLSAMEAMLGDYNHDGYIDNGETAATTASFLLWSAGPDETYGPVNFQNSDLTGVTEKNEVNACDDVTNFTFAQ
jgi:type II secretory pathway pseudopilin PulG